MSLRLSPMDIGVVRRSHIQYEGRVVKQLLPLCENDLIMLTDIKNWIIENCENEDGLDSRRLAECANYILVCILNLVLYDVYTSMLPDSEDEERNRSSLENQIQITSEGFYEILVDECTSISMNVVALSEYIQITHTQFLTDMIEDVFVGNFSDEFITVYKEEGIIHFKDIFDISIRPELGSVIVSYTVGGEFEISTSGPHASESSALRPL